MRNIFPDPLRPLAEGEEKRYSEYPLTEQQFTLMEHCYQGNREGFHRWHTASVYH